MNSRDKGARGEREWRDELRAQGYQARRGQQFSGSPDSPDVISNLPIHWEVKRTEKVLLRDWLAQAEGDCGGKPWVIAHKQNRGPWLTICSSETFFRAIRGDFAQPVTPETLPHLTSYDEVPIQNATEGTRKGEGETPNEEVATQTCQRCQQPFHMFRTGGHFFCDNCACTISDNLAFAIGAAGGKLADAFRFPNSEGQTDPKAEGGMG